MRPNKRSISGAMLMLVITPAIIGLLACMPVPIGDPERSRIDPDISGAWVLMEGDSDASFYAFEPYDKRTWLLTSVPIEQGVAADLSGYELDSYADLAGLIENESVGKDGVTASKIGMYKAWRTKLGGEWFMTWEPKGLIGEDSFEPEIWFVFRMEKVDENTINLYLVNGEDEVFKEVEKTRRAYERVLKNNLNNEDVISDEPIPMIRVQPEHRAFFEELAGEVISVDQ